MLQSLKKCCHIGDDEDDVKVLRVSGFDRVGNRDLGGKWTYMTGCLACHVFHCDKGAFAVVLAEEFASRKIVKTS